MSFENLQYHQIEKVEIVEMEEKSFLPKLWSPVQEQLEFQHRNLFLEDLAFPSYAFPKTD